MIRASVVVFGLAGASLTFLHSGVMAFWVLGGEVAYILMFPQLLCVLFIPSSNGYGAVAGFLVGVALRLLCGEPLLSLPPAIRFPGCTLPDGQGEGSECSDVQLWPIRSICMLVSLMTVVTVSRLVAALLDRGLIPEAWDVFRIKCRPVGGVEEEPPTMPLAGQEDVLPPTLESTC